jgi:hypothetical protein
MEESLVLGVLKNSGIVGLVVVFLCFIVWQFFRFAMNYIQASVENNKQVLEAKTANNNSLTMLNNSLATLNEGLIRQSESVIKLNESVVNSGQLIMSKLERINQEMEDLIGKNHNEVMLQLRHIQAEIKEILNLKNQL